MRINPDYLVTFSAVAELGSVSKAAEFLHLSQPAVSGQLRALSDAVGAPLYTRHSRGVTLTADGLELLPLAQAIARNIRRVGDLAHQNRNHLKKQVRLGVSWTLATRAVHLAARFSGDTLKVSLHSDHTPRLIQMVAEGELDATLAVDASHALPDGLEARRFSSEDLRLIVPGGHRLAESGYVNPSVLHGETVLWPMPESSVRRRAVKLLQASGVTPQRELELGSFLALKSALVEGLGMALLPRTMVSLEIADGHLSSLGLEANDITLGYHVVSAPLALLPGAVREVLEHLGRERLSGSADA
ncbi:LysR family transcriptional regulator [Deinococcus arenicola]|uniref:LysR family transcriptional regulator n=1 Tax=Deinococcus arenicola TaxID=2994950 RepID=A0ABU4DV55_9DEIO|nr:LysR family transcriptional regulator [Deinococcus sp. ZS9-10]MDV6375574.1 LysR family transcriptional regulator [Deinococcus sp. ZS9-10]